MLFDVLRRSLIWIVSGTATVVLTACYGTYCTVKELSRKVLLVDPLGKPIPGLKVTDWGVHLYGYSDENGEVLVNGTYCSYESGVTVEIEDVDGAKNGVYALTNRKIPPGEGTVTLELVPEQENDEDVVIH